MNSRLVIVVSILAITLGLYGLLQTPQPNQQTDVVKTSVTEEKVKVYIANEDLAKGQQIDRSKVSIEWLTKTQANKKGIDKDVVLAFDSILLARKNIAAGGIIYPEFTIDPQDEQYVDFVTKPGHIPFPLEVESDAVVGGVIHASSLIDLLALSSREQNMATETMVSSRTYTGVSLTPLLLGIKVIKVDVVTEQAIKNSSKPPKIKTTLILELTPKQVATVTVAKKIAQLEVHKSIGNFDKQEMSADAGDVLDDYKSIKEFRANDAKIN
jgi:pilus assembly protein CpaB